MRQADAVDEELAIQMVDLMLQRLGEQAFALDLKKLSLQVLGPHLGKDTPLGFGPYLGKRKAAFFLMVLRVDAEYFGPILMILEQEIL